VLIEVYLRERSGAEAARTLGVPVGTVKSRTFYALRVLREVMERRGFRGSARPADDPPGE
jgi:RNA polymerase sigma-70 factor (ECF subfamily)